MVCVSTPDGMHYEWASKALNAGKHVLLEKPFTSNADEAKRLVQLATEKGVVLEEAFHWQFHPAAHKWRQVLDSGEYGRIIRTEATMTASPAVPGYDIRWKFDLAGGSLMDMTYALSFTRAILESTKRCTRISTFEGPKGNQVHSRIYKDMSRKGAMCGLVPRFWELECIEVENEKAAIYYYKATMPHLYHYIAISDKTTGESRGLQQYSDGPIWGNQTTSAGGKGGSSNWSTYRYQLEAFVDAVKEKKPATWITGDESIWQMHTIDALYEAAGLPVRPSMELKYG